MTDFSSRRRRFLSEATLLALGVPALSASWAGAARAAAARTYVAGVYGLELDGQFVGPLTGFLGGNTTADVVSEPAGPDLIQHKHPGPARTEPITIECGLPMARTLYDWIKASIEPGAKLPRKSGAIIEFDVSRKEMGRRVFTNAAITEVEFPACDGSAKDQARLAVTFAPDSVRLAASKGTVFPNQARQAWLRSNFRLQIQGLEQATTRVSKIEAIELKVAPRAIQVPNLVITVADSSIAPFYGWLDDFLIKGNSRQERAGTLDYLTPDLRSTLVTLHFFNLGIVKAAPDAAGTADTIRRSRVEMYCEALRADFSALEGRAKGV
jgi:hypothetical protein